MRSNGTLASARSWKRSWAPAVGAVPAAQQHGQLAFRPGRWRRATRVLTSASAERHVADRAREALDALALAVHADAAATFNAARLALGHNSAVETLVAGIAEAHAAVARAVAVAVAGARERLGLLAILAAEAREAVAVAQHALALVVAVVAAS